MKITSLAVLLLAVASADAFSSPSFGVALRNKSLTQLGAARKPGVIRPDASAAVEEALKITASFGIDSKEAAAAWDIVEEIDASDNRYD